MDTSGMTANPMHVVCARHPTSPASAVRRGPKALLSQTFHVISRVRPAAPGGPERPHASAHRPVDPCAQALPSSRLASRDEGQGIFLVSANESLGILVDGLDEGLGVLMGAADEGLRGARDTLQHFP